MRVIGIIMCNPLTPLTIFEELKIEAFLKGSKKYLQRKIKLLRLPLQKANLHEKVLLNFESLYLRNRLTLNLTLASFISKVFMFIKVFRKEVGSK